MLRQILTVALALSACTKDAATPSPAAQPWSVELTSPTPTWSKGREAQLTFSVKAAKGFHINADYPVAFTVQADAGLPFATERVRLMGGDKTACVEQPNDTCQVVFSHLVTPEQVGAVTVAGVLSFSVCSGDKCLIEKVPLALGITVN